MRHAIFLSLMLLALISMLTIASAGPLVVSESISDAHLNPDGSAHLVREINITNPERIGIIPGERTIELAEGQSVQNLLVRDDAGKAFDSVFSPADKNIVYWVWEPINAGNTLRIVVEYDTDSNAVEVLKNCDNCDPIATYLVSMPFIGGLVQSRYYGIISALIAFTFAAGIAVIIIYYTRRE
jgi:hypothetical protein